MEFLNILIGTSIRVSLNLVNLRWLASLYFCHLHRDFAWSWLNFISYFIVFCFCEYYLLFFSCFLPQSLCWCRKMSLLFAFDFRSGSLSAPLFDMPLCPRCVGELTPCCQASRFISCGATWDPTLVWTLVVLIDVLTLFLILHRIHVTFLNKYTFAVDWHMGFSKLSRFFTSSVLLRILKN